MDEDVKAILKAIAANKGDVPTPGEFIRWFGTKTPEGMLVLSLAFVVFSIGLWVLAHALIILGLIT
jgi:hypothetical protein